MAGFVHARGPGKQDEGIPASNFSEGDALVYDSNSSLSRAPADTLHNTELAGIARADSDASVNDRVPYTRPTDQDTFLSELTNAAVGSDVTKGFAGEITEDDEGRHYSTTSNANATMVVEEGTAVVRDQSVQSRVMIRFLNTVLEHD